MVNYSIRTGEPGDTAKFRELWEYCFPQDDQTFLDWYFSEYHKPEYGYLAEDNGRLVGAATAMPYLMSIRQGDVKAVFIQGVSIAPEYRRTGAPEQLLNTMLQDLKQQKVGLALLTPFSSGYYRRFNFVNAINLCHTNGYIEDIKFLQTFSPEFHAIHTNRPTEFVDQALQSYNKSCRFQRVFIKRTRENMYYKLLDLQNQGGHMILLTNNNGEPYGHMLYFLTQDCIDVREIVCPNVKAGRHLLSLIYGHGTNIKQCKITTADSDIGQILLPCDSSQIKELIAMAKIVDIEAAFNDLEYGADGEIYLLVENNNYHLTVKGGKGKIKPCGAKIPAKAHVAMFTEMALTTLYLGVYSACMLHLSGTLIAEDETVRLLDAMFPRLQRYFNEEF